MCVSDVHDRRGRGDWGVWWCGGAVLDSTGLGCESDAIDRSTAAFHRQLTVLGGEYYLVAVHRDERFVQ
jgi:hypothetical protein